MIVCKTDCVCAQFLDEVDVFLVFLFGDCPTHILSVLVTGYAVEGIFSAVEPEAVFVCLHCADTKADNSFIAVVVCGESDFCCVECRVFNAVPKSGIFKGVGEGCFCSCRCFCRCHHFAIKEDVALYCPAVGCTGDIAFHRDCCTAVFVDDGCHFNAFSTQIVKVKSHCGCFDDIHVSVDTAKESEVCHLRIDSVVCGVVCGHDDCVFAVNKLVGDVGTEG